MPRTRLLRLLRLAPCVLVGALWLVPAPARAAVDLTGTWYVLLHYTDSSTANPELMRWEDRIWEFEPKGDRLAWTDYPIVVFDDKAGRWEGRHRVLTAWEPNAGQWAEIAAGIPVNTRGSRTKTLRRTDGGGWSTGGGAGGRSGFVTFSQTWTIEGLDGLPAITWQDDMGGGGEMDDLSGTTRFTAQRVDASGDLIVGRYERDGVKQGTFRLIRAGSARGLDSGGKTPNQKQAEQIYEQILSSGVAQQELATQLREALAEYRIDPRTVDPDALAASAVEQLRGGLPPADLGAWIEKEIVREIREKAFGFAEAGAKPDPSARYALPFDTAVPRQLSQGANGQYSHRGRGRYAFDFSMPVGTPIRVARAGKVVGVQDGFTEGGPMKTLRGRANVVTVLHEDGTFARYVHLSPGIAVQEGQQVAAGDVLGKSGNTGYTTAPHLHFEVDRLTSKGDVRSVDIRFDDGSPDGFVPAEGLYYGGNAAAKP